VAQQQRLKRTHPAQFIVPNPNFYLSDIPPVGQPSSPELQPRSMKSIHICETHTPCKTGLSVERQLGQSANIAELI